MRGYKRLAMMLLKALAVGLLIGLLVGALLERIGLEPFAFLIHRECPFRDCLENSRTGRLERYFGSAER